MKKKISKEIRLKLHESLRCNNKTEAIKTLKYWDELGRAADDRYQTEYLLAKNHLTEIINKPSILDKVAKSIISQIVIEFIKQYIDIF